MNHVFHLQGRYAGGEIFEVEQGRHHLVVVIRRPKGSHHLIAMAVLFNW
uniref:Uncharacterized protein n=1 Tax=Nelumbo nucifera TaxID=4432 RepID=A0A822YRD4_NELNU|nr:TPA_asm: hypothetical protein HUJ06_005720 [Nelumbo nucifera]